MPLQRLDDRGLLARVGSDPEAYGVFYDRYERPLLAFLRRTTGRSDVAADVAAEVFATMLEQVLAGRAIHDPAAYLYGVARNKVLEGARRGAVEERARAALAMAPLTLRDDVLEHINELGDDGERALAALADLPEEQRNAVSARVLDELTYDEIAARLGCSNAVVRKRVSRGLLSLRRRLAAEKGATG